MATDYTSEVGIASSVSSPSNVPSKTSTTASGPLPPDFEHFNTTNKTYTFATLIGKGIH